MERPAESISTPTLISSHTLAAYAAVVPLAWADELTLMAALCSAE